MKVFISGSRSIRIMPKKVSDFLGRLCKLEHTILVGDCYGVDSLVQGFLKSDFYELVTVYSTGDSVRNNFGNWRSIKVSTDKVVKDFDFYSVKDKRMCKDADFGFVIWDGKSRGSKENMINLIEENKLLFCYFSPCDEIYKIENKEQLNKLIF